MKNVRFFIVIGRVVVFGISGILGKEVDQRDDIHIRVDDIEYVFGLDNGLYKIVDQDGITELYSFGEAPGWLMLTFLHQHKDVGSPNGTSKAYNIIPQFEAEGALYDFYCVDREKVAGEHGSEWITYTFDLVDSKGTPFPADRDIALTVYLGFIVYKDDPFKGVSIWIDVDNNVGSTDEDLFRLMEVRCPFLRMPAIGADSSDDVVTSGNMLIRDPIRSLSSRVEPWSVSNGSNEFGGGTYPRGFHFKAYYDRDGSNDGDFGRGLYLALYNANRVVAENNLYKHLESEGFSYGCNSADWRGTVGNNIPPQNERDYLVWEVVRFTEDINPDQNDYPYDLTFTTFLQFFRGASEPSEKAHLDWYKAAMKYRNAWEAINTHCNSSQDCNYPFDFFTSRDFDINLWPDEKLKANSGIADWAKYHPFMLYVSPQADVSDHPVMRTNLAIHF